MRQDETGAAAINKCAAGAAASPGETVSRLSFGRDYD